MPEPLRFIYNEGYFLFKHLNFLINVFIVDGTGTKCKLYKEVAYSLARLLNSAQNPYDKVLNYFPGILNNYD